tara:strand:+ start:529 stop:654 length:126 start_codon:yes stop_codon:yes gene_type:complete
MVAMVLEGCSPIIQRACSQAASIPPASTMSMSGTVEFPSSM